MSAPGNPEVTFRPAAEQPRIIVSLTDLLEYLLARQPAAADDAGRRRVAELAAELLAELRRTGQ